MLPSPGKNAHLFSKVISSILLAPNQPPIFCSFSCYNTKNLQKFTLAKLFLFFLVIQITRNPYWDNVVGQPNTDSCAGYLNCCIRMEFDSVRDVFFPFPVLCIWGGGVCCIYTCVVYMMKDLLSVASSHPSLQLCPSLPSILVQSLELLFW